jgi:predicted phosphate transport protein (TIGR00153 family)
MVFGRILDILSKSEREVLRSLSKHVDIALESSKHLEFMLMRLKERDEVGVLREYGLIDDLETDADVFHRSVVSRISAGSFFGGIREDLLDMMEKIDSIVDSTKAAGKFLLYSKMNDKFLDYFFQSKIIEFVQACESSVEALRDAINSLGSGKNSVITHAKLVENKEWEADKLKESVLHHILSVDSCNNALLIVQLRDFVLEVDDIANYAEDASDDLLVFVAKGYS